MSPDDAKAVLGPLGLVGTLGFVLPQLDKSWSAEPDDPDVLRRLRTGEAAYVGFAIVVGLIAARAYGTSAPFWFVLAWAGVVVVMQEQAMRHQPQTA